MKNVYASRVMMVKPKGFAFNAETASSNAFQNKPEIDISELQHIVAIEFETAVKTIREAGVDVIIFEEPSGIANPDALFPNNWFSSQPDGSAVIYPMASENRRKERHISWIDTMMASEMIPNSTILDLSHNEEIGKYLEGTGSIVFDHQNKVAFAALSQRTDKSLFDELCFILEYKGISFETKDLKDLPIYHTNVLMSISPEWAVYCPDVLAASENEKMIDHLLAFKKRPLMKINIHQMQNFAANIIGLQSLNGKKLVLISKTAFTSLTTMQQSWIKDKSTPVIVDIPTIEMVGGGGIRCMVAELFS